MTSTTLAQRIERFDAYFRSANGVPPNARISVPTAEWQELRAALMPQCLHQIAEPAAPQAAPAAVAVPDGWALVPIKPTEAMLCALMQWDGETGLSILQQYKAMLAEAPALAATPAAGAAQAVEPDLHAAIMNLQVSKSAIEPFDINRRLAYKMGHRDARHAAAELVAARAPQAAATQAAPVLYVSKGQLDNHTDPDGTDTHGSGRYLPARKTPKGNFTTPLYEHSTPAEQEGQACDAERLDWLIGQDNCVVCEGVNGFWVMWIDEHDHRRSEYQRGSFPSAREAIDAAITAQAGKGVV